MENVPSFLVIMAILAFAVCGLGLILMAYGVWWEDKRLIKVSFCCFFGVAAMIVASEMLYPEHILVPRWVIAVVLMALLLLWLAAAYMLQQEAKDNPFISRSIKR